MAARGGSGDPANRGSLDAELRRWSDKLGPQRIVVLAPGDWRVLDSLRALPLPIEIRPTGISCARARSSRRSRRSTRAWRHRDRFAANARVRPQYLNLARKEAGEFKSIRRRADALKVELTAETFL